MAMPQTVNLNLSLRPELRNQYENPPEKNKRGGEELAENAVEESSGIFSMANGFGNHQTNLLKVG